MNTKRIIPPDLRRRDVVARAAGRRFFKRGGSVLEMVLTLTILLNLTFGAIEFGYY